MTDELMTTQEVQGLLRVDRTTIYAMLKDGRLPGFKVGGRWRFSRGEVESWLRERQQDGGLAELQLPVKPSPQVLSVASVQAIQSIFAEAMGVSSVVTQLDGEPITQISNECRLCQLLRSTEAGEAACRKSWSSLANQAGHRPQLLVCHAGLRYARGRIEVEDEFVAMVLAGEFLLEGEQAALRERLPRLAAESGVALAALEAEVDSVHVLDREAADRLTHLLDRAGKALSLVGRERLVLLRRLRQIAEVSTIQ